MQSEEEWTAKQIHFLKEHQYFTDTAKSEMETNKKEQIENIQKRILLAKRMRRLSSGTKENVKEIIWMILGVLVSGFALKSFLVPHHFFDGGVTGISLLLHEIYHFNLAVTIILANLPLIALSYFTVSKRFAAKMLL